MKKLLALFSLLSACAYGYTPVPSPVGQSGNIITSDGLNYQWAANSTVGPNLSLSGTLAVTGTATFSSAVNVSTNGLGTTGTVGLNLYSAGVNALTFAGTNQYATFTGVSGGEQITIQPSGTSQSSTWLVSTNGNTIITSGNVLYLVGGGGSIQAKSDFDPFYDNNNNLGAASNRWLHANFGPSGVTIANGTSGGATITTTGASGSEELVIGGPLGVAISGTSAGTVTLSAGAGSATNSSVLSTSVVILTAAGTTSLVSPLPMVGVTTGKIVVAGTSGDARTYNYRIIN